MAKETKTAEGTMIELNELDCLKIVKQGGLKPYVNTEEGSQNHGKRYQSYRYNNAVFVVHEEDDFNNDFKAGDLFAVDLLRNEIDQLSFVQHVSATRYNRVKRNMIERDAYTVEVAQMAMSRKFNIEELAQ